MRRALLLAAVCSMAAACSGPVDTDVTVFDAGFTGGSDAQPLPDATPTDAADIPDAGSLDATGPDAMTRDGGFVDGGVVDGGFVDGGAVDGGFVDGGVDDAGELVDGGAVDGGFVDGGAVDGGFVDGGTPDSGVPPDAGFPDAEADAGSPDAEADAGSPDAEPDAGFPDADVDAGFPDAEVDGGPVDAGNVDAGAADAAVPPPSSYTARPIDTQIVHGQHVTIADIDGDGDNDVVSSISLTDTVRLYLNGGNSTGGGNGTTWQTIQVAANNSIVAMGSVVADFDGDLDLDVVTIGLFDRATGFNSRGNLTLYLRGAAITNWTTVPVGVGANFWGPRCIAAGDLTGDGLPDVVTGGIETYDVGGNVMGHGVRWHRNTTGNFAVPVDVDALLLEVENVHVVDVDGDGVNDIVAAGRVSNEIVWYENNRAPGVIDPSPTFTRHVLATLATPTTIEMAQLDADPALEVVVMHDDGNGGAIAWYDAPANPRAGWSRQVISLAFGGGTNSFDVYRLAAADLNADTLTDVVWVSDAQDEVRTFVRSGTGWVSQRVATMNNPVGVAAGDLSGDGRADIVSITYLNAASSDRVDWYQTVP